MTTPRTGRHSTGRTGAPQGRSRLRDTRVIVFAVVLAVYAVYTVAVVHHTWVPIFDRWVYTVHIKRDHLTDLEYDLIYRYVTLGQRGPATLVFLPYFIWTAYRLRSARPLVMLGVALLLLNLSVGVVKLATGRLGPKETVDVHNVFAGGNIYPSGHVSNAVVLYGLVAWISLRHRKLFVAAAVWIAVSVGFGTIAINTHWFSDVIGGYFAGALVLLALPWFLPPAERAVAAAWTRYGPRVEPRLLAVLDRLRRRPSATDVAASNPGVTDELVPDEAGRPAPAAAAPAAAPASTEQGRPGTPPAGGTGSGAGLARALARRVRSEKSDAGQFDGAAP